MARPKTDTTVAATPVRILAAAETAFAAGGYTPTNLADIARSVGIRRPSLLYHFPSKEDLYSEVVAKVFGQMGQALLQAQEQPGDFEERLVSLARTFATFVQANPACASIIVRELVAPDGPGHAILRNQVVPLFDGVVAWIETEGRGRLRSTVDVRSAALHIVSDALLRNATGPLRQDLWGGIGPEHSVAITRTTLLDLEAP
jgi:AcrR family transcriptional regulator